MSEFVPVPPDYTQHAAPGTAYPPAPTPPAPTAPAYVAPPPPPATINPGTINPGTDPAAPRPMGHGHTAATAGGYSDHQPLTIGPGQLAVPSIGRIVHYTSYGTPGGEFASVCRSAIVTQVHGHDGVVGLAVLNPTGLFFDTSCDYDDALHAGGTWHWPERV